MQRWISQPKGRDESTEDKSAQMTALMTNLYIGRRQVSKEAGLEQSNDVLTVRGLTRLSYAATTSGAAGVVAELSKLVNGWAILLDRHDTPIATSGASRIHINDAIAVASGRSREARMQGLLRFLIGRATNPAAFLVVSPKGRRISQVTVWAEHASSLLSLVADPLRSSRLERIAREDAIDLLLCDSIHLARGCAERWGLNGEQFSVVLFGATSRSLVIESVVSEWLRAINVTECMAMRKEGLCLVLEARQVPALLEVIRSSATQRTKSFHCGVGQALQLGCLQTSLHQARIALEVSIGDRSAAQEYAQLETVRRVVHSMSPGDREALLGPLRLLQAAGDDLFAELLQSAQVFLAENGAWEASAAQLRIHRHTLRSRVSRIEDITGLSFLNSDDRMTLLLAIRAHALE